MAGNDPVPQRKWVILVVALFAAIAIYLATKG